MVSKISVSQYKKMRSLCFDFSSGVNVISGTNGTCKTSLLHIISNSFQAVTKTCHWLNDATCLTTINKINNQLNSKIESLAKGDKEHNDPTNGHPGTVFTIEYTDREPLTFRKHNSKVNHRYAIKPYYQKGSNDSLPYCPVIYLSLARLFPFGEFQDDEAIKQIGKDLPQNYQEELAQLYSSFTFITIASSTPQKMGDIKTRTDFATTSTGIDSNTISAGEDNLFIILKALVSLKYYYGSIQSNNTIESILLIDELDAALHPSFQFKILELFRTFSTEYKIQIVFTTHSLFLLEAALKKKDNVIYLIDNVTSVTKMDSPDIYKIKMYLSDQTRDNIYFSKMIPIFTEDYEARFFLKILFEYYENNKSSFANKRRFFHFVDTNIGATNLINMFNDVYLLKSTMQSICVLDGDQHSKQSYEKYIITLPGTVPPETLIMDYSLHLYETDDPFWTDEIILENNYGKRYFLGNIKPDLDAIPRKLQELREIGKSTHGVERDLRKKAFKKHERFFELLFRHWVNNPDNKIPVNKFYNSMYIMFQKTSLFHGINPKEWIWNEEEVR